MDCDVEQSSPRNDSLEFIGRKVMNIKKVLITSVIGAMVTCGQVLASTYVPCGGADGDSNTNCWSCGTTCTARLDSKGNFTVSGTGAMDEYSPIKKNGYNQTTAPWNDVMNQIKHVTIEDGITSIGERSFTNAYNVESINFGSAKTVGVAAFYIDRSLSGQTKLQNLTIPASVEEIQKYAFACYDSLQNINFEDDSKLKTIGEAAFAVNPNLVNVTLPDSVKSIGGYAFGECTGLQKVILPDNENLVLGDQIFGWTYMTEVILPENFKAANSSFRNMQASVKVYCTQAMIDARKCNSSYLYKTPLSVTHYERDGDHYNIYDSNGEIVAQYGSLIDFGTTNYYVPKAPKEAKRIYTVEEATEAAKGNKNTFSIRYR